MNQKRTYFPTTTAQQRRLLFEVWKDTGNRAEACRQAHVSQSTFYNWKSRFAAGGYAALEETRSHARQRPSQTPPEEEAQVLEMRRQHPAWGKRRIADELAKGNHWVPLVSPNTVKRILQDAGLWPEAETTAKKGVRHPGPDGGQPGPSSECRPLFCAGASCNRGKTAGSQRFIGAFGHRAARRGRVSADLAGPGVR